MNLPLHLQSVVVNATPVNLYVPDGLAVRTAYEGGRIAFPFWSQVWPAAVALSDFIATHPHLLRNKTVLELGAGLGLPSVIAAPCAASVLCTDANAIAVGIAARSAALHRLKNLHTAVLDWTQLPNDLRADVVLLSDVNYAPETFGPLTAVINRFLHGESTVILSTPQRLVAKPFAEALLPHCRVREESEKGGVALTVMVLQGGSKGKA